jgi:signal transduction histidine kinase
MGLSTPECQDKMLQNAVRIPDILDLVSQSRSKNESIKSQVRLDSGVILEVQVYSVCDGVDNDIATLVVLRDLTDTEKMTAIKSQFVANASHELRTPLATIRAAVDSLKLEGTSDAAMFERLLDILDRHTRRLEDMTNDLLDLHMVESSTRQSRHDSVSLGRLRDWVLTNFSAKSDEMSVALSVECPSPEFVLSTDLTLIHLILQNLLTNSIKFTPAGGKIVCDIIPGEKILCLRVSDTGCGIPVEFHDRVFERFFQVSASRSRSSGGSKNGGTGLGLSIVKHAALKLGAGINLESEPGKGTTITIDLPLR